MSKCPFCESQDTLRRGMGPAGFERRPRYMVHCLHCGSFFSVPKHQYFQLYAQQKRDCGPAAGA